MLPQYQTFPDTRGHSDSLAKLECLRLPESLEGKSVLDVACNEGFFCQEAWQRGASRVVGIDKVPGFIERASERDPQTEYRVLDWSRIEELGWRFDVILLLSALHYAERPRRLLRQLFDMLTPDGMLVLECGIAPGRKPKWVRVDRPRGDTVLHPTRGMVMNAIPGAVVRELGPSVPQPGDPVDRFAFRITRVKPIVMLVSGRSGSGKSTLARSLTSDNVAVVSVDHLVWTLPQWCADPQLVALREAVDYKRNQIGRIADAIAAAGAADAFAEQVLESAGAFPREVPVTLMEGYALGCGGMEAAFAKRLVARGAFVWHVTPDAKRPLLLGGASRSKPAA